MSPVKTTKIILNMLTPPTVNLVTLNTRVQTMKEFKNIRLPKSLSVKISLDGQGDYGFIEGLVKQEGVGVPRRVLCYHRRSGLLVGTTYSSISGEYRFDNLISGMEYIVTSIDEDGVSPKYNAVTQDSVVASGRPEEVQEKDEVDIVEEVLGD